MYEIFTFVFWIVLTVSLRLKFLLESIVVSFNSCARPMRNGQSRKCKVSLSEEARFVSVGDVVNVGPFHTMYWEITKPFPSR